MGVVISVHGIKCPIHWRIEFGEFDDPDGELSILSWSIEDLDGPDNPPTGEPYIQISSNVVYELSGSTLFAGQLPSTSTQHTNTPRSERVAMGLKGSLGRAGMPMVALFRPTKALKVTNILTVTVEAISSNTPPHSHSKSVS